MTTFSEDNYLPFFILEDGSIDGVETEEEYRLSLNDEMNELRKRLVKDIDNLEEIEQFLTALKNLEQLILTTITNDVHNTRPETS